MATDIFTTALNAAGIQQPQDRTIDGANIARAIKDNTHLHNQLFWRKGYNSAVRDSRWKMSWNEQYGDTLLYDLVEDPFEENNIFGTQPDVQSGLFAAHRKWASELPGPAWPSLIDYYYEEDGVRYWFDN